MSSVFKGAWFKRSQSGGRAGIALTDTGFALAVVRRGDARPALEHCALHSTAADAAATLKEVLTGLGAARSPVCAVIDGEDYQVVQVEAPEVLPSEMRAAIRWRLRDTLNFSVDEAAVDVFEIPDPVRRTQARMLFAVAAREAAVRRISSTVGSAAKGFNAIDIPELCLRNLSALLPQDARGVAMLALHERFAQLVITRQGVMYLTRRIDLGRFDPHARERAAIDAPMLALELQRSLDYYESHYDETPIGDLIIAPPGERGQHLVDALKNETSLRVALLDTRALFDVQKQGEPISSWECLMALGAALRDDTMEL